MVERDALQLMTGTQWLQLLYRHVPDRYEHLVRYVGWYSNRVRSQRAANDAHAPMAMHHFGSGIWSQIRFTASAIL